MAGIEATSVAAPAGGADPDELLQMFSSITTTDHDELVDQFAFLLEVDVSTATFFLESSNWNIELAANNYFNTLGNSRGQDVSGHEMDFEQQDEHDQLAAWRNGLGSAPQARLITDLSFTQQSVYPPNAQVSVAMEFENPSDVEWPPGTTLSFYQGDTHFDAPQEIKVAAAPKTRILVHFTFTMPSECGSFSASWCLRTWQGYFGEPVWVVFNVQPGTFPLQQHPPEPAASAKLFAPVGSIERHDEDQPME